MTEVPDAGRKKVGGRPKNGLAEPRMENGVLEDRGEGSRLTQHHSKRLRALCWRNSRTPARHGCQQVGDPSEDRGKAAPSRPPCSLGFASRYPSVRCHQIFEKRAHVKDRSQSKLTKERNFRKNIKCDTVPRSQRQPPATSNQRTRPSSYSCMELNLQQQKWADCPPDPAERSTARASNLRNCEIRFVAMYDCSIEN